MYSSVLQCTLVYSSVLYGGGKPPRTPPPLPVLLVLLVPLVLLLVLVLPVLLVLLILPCSKQSNFQNTMVENNANHGIFAPPKLRTTMYHYVLPVLLVVLVPLVLALESDSKIPWLRTMPSTEFSRLLNYVLLCTTMYYQYY